MSERRTHLLVYYPASAEAVTRLEACLGVPVTVITVSNMADRSMIAMIREMRRFRPDRLLIARDAEAPQMVSILMGLALISGARHRALVEANGRQIPFGVPEVARVALTILCEGVEALLRLGVGWLRCRILQRMRRVKVSGGDGDRILYLRTNLPVGVRAGGMISHTLGIIQGLAANGLGCDFLSSAAVDGVDLIPGVRRMPVDLPTALLPVRELNHALYDSRMATSGETGAKAGRARWRMIYHRLAPGSIAAVLVSRRCRLPLVLEYNGSEVWIGDRWGTPFRFRSFYLAAEDVCLRHAHKVVAVSAPLRDDLVARGIEPGRIICLPNGVDTGRFDPARFDAVLRQAERARLGIPADALVLGFIGTFGPWHGAEPLAEAFRRVMAGEGGAPWGGRVRPHLLMIGDGARRPAVEAILADPACRGNVTLTGLVASAEAARMLACCDVFVSPHCSNEDGTPFFGSPTKLFEYLSMGRPVIASDLGQIGEILSGCRHMTQAPPPPLDPDGDATDVGLLVRPGSVDDLVGAIRLAADSHAWRAAAGARARARAVRDFTWQAHVRTVLSSMDTA